MKQSLLFFLGIALAISARAAEITDSEASAAVQAWITEESTLGRKHGSVTSCETLSTPSGARLHVVSLAGGGFAVTPTDDRIDPIIAFVPSGVRLVQSNANPLWALLSGDIEARERAAGVSSETKSAKRVLLGASSAGGTTSRAQERWAALLGRPSPSSSGRRTILAAKTPEGPTDIRVDSFVESRWSQDVHNNQGIGKDGNFNCYNYYTPNNYPCGCVATAAGQVMRYWQWPTTSVTAKSYNCKVDGTSASYKMKGGSYDWKNMPLVPADGVTEAQCKAIGKLTYDIGVSIGTSWNHDDSVANMYALVPRLTTLFGYANAVAAVYIRDTYPYSLDELKKVVIPNCDARTPAIMSISGNGGHAAVVDGYGFSGSDFYIHVNCGWAGLDDAWYLPPNISDFNTIDGFVFNIFPKKTGSILSGRVLDTVGTPIKGATVTLRIGTKVVGTATTDESGIYAFIADAGQYSVTATSGDASQSITVTLSQTTGTSLGPDGENYDSAASIGNSYGNDITLVGVAGIPPLDISPGSGLFYPSAKVAITCSEPGVTIHYTLDGTEPTDSSPVYSGPLTIEDDVTIKARAWKTGLNPSAVASKTYTYDISKTTLLKGDKTNFPFVIYGAGGEKTVADASIYTEDAGEINHADYYWQEHTIWYKWKAPGSGTMRFAVQHGYYGPYYDEEMEVWYDDVLHIEHSSIAVYRATSVSSAARLACASSASAEPPYYNKKFPDFSPWVDVPVRQDEEYLVVAISCIPSNKPVFLTLSWSGDIEYEAPFVVVDENGDPHGFASIADAIDAVRTTYPSHKYIQANKDATFQPPNGVRFRAKDGVTLTPLRLSSEYEVPVGHSTAQGVVTYTSDIIATTYTWTGSRDSSWNTAGNWTYKENGTTTTATRHPQAKDTVVFANGASTAISAPVEVHAVMIRLAGQKEGMTLTFNSLGNTAASASHAALTCSSIVFPAGTISIAFGGGASALPSEAELISWSGEAPAGKFAFAAPHEGFELVTAESGLMVVAKIEPMKTQTAVVGGYTWTFAVDGKNAIIYNNGNAAVSPAPEGHIDIPDKLGTYVVSEIGARAFAGCDSMSSVKIPDGVKLIDRDAFADCNALQCAEIGKGVSDSGSGAANIKMGAFAGCGALRAIVFKGAAAPTISADNILDGTPDDCKVYVPKSAKNWPTTWLGKQVVFGDYMVEVRALTMPGAATGCKSLAGGGSYALGKKATLKATPASGYVFAGWYDDMTGGPLSRAASYAYVVTGESMEFLADFVRIDEDANSLGTDLDGRIFPTDDDGAFEMSVDEHVRSRSEFKAAFKNLPAGLKYDAKTYKIAGKATKPGVYEIAMGLTNASVKKAKDYKFTISVPNLHDTLVEVSDTYGPYVPGVEYHETFGSTASDWSVSGLPAGMKWTNKEALDSQKRKVAPCSVYGAPSKPGNYTVYFTKSDAGVKHTSTATFIVSDFPVLTVGTEGKGSGKVTGAGAYPANKKVSLKATADKGSVFRGWYMEPYGEDDIISQAASYPYVMPDADATLVAKFITADEDKKGISTTFNDDEFVFSDDGTNVTKSIPCGVYLEWPIAVSALSLPTVKVAGLPSGLKFTAKDVVDSKTKDVLVPANTIYGTPTAASKVNKGVITPSAVKITVTTAGKTTVNYTVNATVEPMQEWAFGSFEGGKNADGLASLTVSSAGKISGKVQDKAALSWTFSANNFDGYDEVTDVYTATIAAKIGNKTQTDSLTISRGDAGGLVVIGNADPVDRLFQHNWKAEPWKSISSKFDGTLSFDSELDEACPGTVTLAFKKNAGTVTTKGVFGSYSASGAATLTPISMPDDNGEFICYVQVFFPQKADKGFKGYGVRLPVKWNGSNFEFAEDYGL